MPLIPPNSKSAISIHIDNHYRSKVYTTASTVSGHVVVRPQTDLPFDSVQILLLGTSKTRVDAVNIPQATSHTFLKLTMPVPASRYPGPRRVFEARQTYAIPFTFVIPAQLTINACNHNVSSEAVQAHHLRLPPSLGAWERDDFAPNMSRVHYCVKARVVPRRAADDHHHHHHHYEAETTKPPLEAQHEIMVLPATPEDAPLNVTKQDRLYAMSKTKAVRRSILSAKTGTVTARAAQPAPVVLSPDGTAPATTTATVHLEFAPSASGAHALPPPRVTAVAAKVTAVTYFSAGGINHFPDLQRDWTRSYGAEGRGSYSSSVSIPSCTPPGEELTWSSRPTAQARRDSGYGTEEESAALSSSSSGGESSGSRRALGNRGSKTTPPPPHTYTATLRVPVRLLPAHKRTFVPSFHSCIASRVYVLGLAVSLAGTGSSSSSTSSTTTLHLAVPLQVAVAGGLPSFEAAVGEGGVDEDVETFLRPRSLRAPPEVRELYGAQRDEGALPAYREVQGRVAVGG
ncbi:arrestin [Xylariomycetidae sp. FL0641]|nr:arrestin [Xylariomycetidae sp. FL0641]